MKKSTLFLYIDVVLFFFLIFGFHITSLINSSFLVPIIIAIITILYSNNLIFIVKKLLSNINILIISIFFLYSVVIATLIPILHQTFDFTYITNFASQFTQSICIFFFICFILSHKRDNISDYFEKILVYTFIIQSIIQIISFLLPEIANLIHYFYTANDIVNLYERSGKIRGLALASSTGWGLSVGYACTFLFFTKHYLINKEINFPTLLMGLILFTGCFFSGRTAFLGVLLSILYYLLSEKSNKDKIKDLFFILSFFMIIILLFLIIIPLYNNQLVNKLIGFAFEPLINYFASGKIETTSTNTLLSMWDRDISFQTYIIGDGLFTDPFTGKYYMQTDVGYLRNLFYGGLFWIISIIIYHIIISGFFIRRNSKKKLIFFLLIFSFLIEFKAMSLGFNKYLFTILLTYSLSIISDNYTNRTNQNV
ncbi:hypothetical protein [Proteus vulgaris]|uniref:hypothetical protein n=1 Tax=Proteus vulgaris TaxID=585 RepID=UPI000659E0AB|nr:hypothetical protein [Proteus vulgaris]CRL65448.1 hypothetical protein BN1805_03359 [Proteus vulgaris]